MVKRIPLLLSVFVLTSGCAFSAVNRPDVSRYSNQFPRENSYQGTTQEVLDAARSSLEAMGYEILAVTEEISQIRTKVRAVTIPDYCDCGTWNLSPVTGTAESVLVTTVSDQDGDQTRVVLEHNCVTNFSGQNLYGATTRRETYQCASRGHIEKEFWRTLTRILQVRTSDSVGG